MLVFVVCGVRVCVGAVCCVRVYVLNTFPGALFRV